MEFRDITYDLDLGPNSRGKLGSDLCRFGSETLLIFPLFSFLVFHFPPDGFSWHPLPVLVLSLIEPHPRDRQREERLDGIRQQMLQVDPATRIHFEMASFVDETLLGNSSLNLVPYVVKFWINATCFRKLLADVRCSPNFVSLKLGQESVKHSANQECQRELSLRENMIRGKRREETVWEMRENIIGEEKTRNGYERKPVLKKQ